MDTLGLQSAFLGITAIKGSKNRPWPLPTVARTWASARPSDAYELWPGSRGWTNRSRNTSGHAKCVSQRRRSPTEWNNGHTERQNELGSPCRLITLVHSPTIHMCWWLSVICRGFPRLFLSAPRTLLRPWMLSMRFTQRMVSLWIKDRTMDRPSAPMNSDRFVYVMASITPSQHPTTLELIRLKPSWRFWKKHFSLVVGREGQWGMDYSNVWELIGQPPTRLLMFLQPH